VVGSSDVCSGGSSREGGEIVVRAGRGTAGVKNENEKRLQHNFQIKTTAFQELAKRCRTKDGVTR